MKWLSAARGYVFKLVLTQLRQGADKKSLALSCAIGMGFGAFPLIGTTTLLCFAAGHIWKLNQPLLQFVNYIMAPIQLLLIPVFGYAGMHLGSELKVDPHPTAIMKALTTSPALFLKEYGELGLRAVAVWLMVMPVIMFLVYKICYAAISRFERKERKLGEL